MKDWMKALIQGVVIVACLSGAYVAALVESRRLSFVLALAASFMLSAYISAVRRHDL